MRFKLAASLRGFTVSSPYGDNSTYDFILDTGNSLFRIQVKSTGYRVKSRPNCMRFQIHRTNGAAYQSFEVDYFALYDQTDDIFYLIPRDLLDGVKDLTITANGKYKIFKENWNFKEARGSSHEGNEGTFRRTEEARASMGTEDLR